MKNKIFAFAAILLSLIAAPTHASAATTGSAYTYSVAKNQFGETYINSNIGGSSFDCNFVVDSANGNGLGIRNLKGSQCQAVYMHTSASPAAGNPNPNSGYIVVQMTRNFFGYVGGYAGFVSPLTGSAINISSQSLSTGVPYVITQVGTTPAIGWTTLGLPQGLIPAVGQTFIASYPSYPTGSTTGQVQLAAASGAGVELIDVIGDANQLVNVTGGSEIVMRALAPTSSSVTTKIATAPVDNTVIGLHFIFLPTSGMLK